MRKITTRVCVVELRIYAQDGPSSSARIRITLPHIAVPPVIHVAGREADDLGFRPERKA